MGTATPRAPPSPTVGASYTFPSWRLNGVPIALVFATHAYFMSYHTATTLLLRRWWTGHAYSRLPPTLQAAATCALVCAMAWLTAFLESFTIQGVCQLAAGCHCDSVLVP